MTFKKTQLRFAAQVTDDLGIRPPRGCDNFYRSTTRGQSVTAGNLESAAVKPTDQRAGENPPERWVAALPNSVSLVLGPGSWRS